MTSTVELVRAVVALLQAELPPLLAAESLPQVREYLAYEPPVAQAERCPRVWVLVPELRAGKLAGFGGANAHWSRDRVVEVWLANSDPNPETAYLNLYAYADLALRAMVSDLTAGGTGRDVRWLTTDYSPASHRNTGLYRECVLVFQVNRWVTLGDD